MHPIQIAKAYGWLPHVGLDKLADGSTREHLFLANVNHLLSDERCGHPDKMDPEIMGTDADRLSARLGMPEGECECLQKMHFRLSEAAGRGSWPAGCHIDLYNYPDRHCVTYYPRMETFGGSYTRNVTDGELRHLASTNLWGTAESLLDRFSGKRMIDACWWFLEEAYRRVNVKLIRVPEEQGHDIVLLGRNIPGSTIGLGWLPDGTCRDVVESHYDNGWRPAFYSWLLLLWHEVGHNMRLEHEFSNQSHHRSVMSYSWPNNGYGFSTGNDPHVLPPDASLPELRQFFGDGQIPTDEPIPPGDVKLTLPIKGFFTDPNFRGYTILPDGRVAFLGIDGNGDLAVLHVS